MLLLSLGCVDTNTFNSKETPSQKKSDKRKKDTKQKVFSKPSQVKSYLNLTKRHNLNLSVILDKHTYAEKITIRSGHRGSLSFKIDELEGNTYVNVINAPEYEIIITDKYGKIFKERIK